MPTDGPLSVPAYRERPPRELTDAERSAFATVADALIASSGGIPVPSAAKEFDRWLDRALAARRDAFDDVLEAALRVKLQADARAALRHLADTEPAVFQQLSTVVAGAYLMIPAVRREIGYPGQLRVHARFDEAADEIMDGILDPVIERGQVYRDD